MKKTRVLKRVAPWILMSWGLWLMAGLWPLYAQATFTMFIIGAVIIDEYYA